LILFSISNCHKQDGSAPKFRIHFPFSFQLFSNKTEPAQTTVVSSDYPYNTACPNVFWSK